jgi:hypothetical protein
MTTSTGWPRIGPATHRAATQEDGLRREASPQVEGHLTASLQVAKSAPGTLSRWRHGFEPRWDYERRTPGQGTSPWIDRLLEPRLKRRISRKYPAAGSRVVTARKGTRVEGGCTSHRCVLHGRWAQGCLPLGIGDGTGSPTGSRTTPGARRAGRPRPTASASPSSAPPPSARRCTDGADR